MAAYVRPALLLLLALLGACSAATSTSSPTSAEPSGANDSADPLAFFNCQAVEIEAPDGVLVKLDGAWLTDGGGAFDLRQTATCLLFGSGTVPTDRGEAGQEYPDRRIVFAARIFQADLTILGWYYEIEVAGDRAPDNHPLRMNITFVPGPSGSSLVRLSRFYDPLSELYEVNWHNLCFVRETEAPADGPVPSDMCPQPQPPLIPPNQN